VSSADARRVLNAGWAEHALHDAVSVCGLFNFMNRFVSGLEVSALEDYCDLRQPPRQPRLRGPQDDAVRPLSQRARSRRPRTYCPGELCHQGDGPHRGCGPVGYFEWLLPKERSDEHQH